MIGMYPIASVPIADMQAVDAGTIISATTGTIVLAGLDATIRDDKIITATTGAIALAGLTASIVNDNIITATTGNILMRGHRIQLYLNGVLQKSGTTVGGASMLNRRRRRGR